MRTCYKCKIEKPLVEFCKSKQNKDGHKNFCKECDKAKSRAYGEKNREKELARFKVYYQNNKEKKNAYQKNYLKNRKATDVNFKITCTLRKKLWRALKGNYKSGSAVRDLGCTIPELKKYLEAQFKPGMTWDNYGDWHIDHIIPLSSFNLTDRDKFLQANHYMNLQPLWAEDNYKKGNKLTQT